MPGIGLTTRTAAGHSLLARPAHAGTESQRGSFPTLSPPARATVGAAGARGAVSLAASSSVCGRPIAAPSANRSNRISPTRAEHVLADLEGLIDLVIDSGPTAIGLESTVLDLTGPAPRVLRPGPISRSDLELALGGRRVLELAPSERVALPLSPGQMPVHYAPRTPAYHVGSFAELARFTLPEDLALIVIGEHPGAGSLPVSPQFVLESPESASRALYDVLHRCDALAKMAIIVVLPPDEPEWRPCATA